MATATELTREYNELRDRATTRFAEGHYEWAYLLWLDALNLEKELWGTQDPGILSQVEAVMPLLDMAAVDCMRAERSNPRRAYSWSGN